MAIELKDVEHLAGLARIAVSDNEKELFRRDLEDILAYVSKIKEGELLGQGEMGEQGKIHNVMRADENPHEPGMFTESLLSAAPMREDNRVFVKKIL